MYQKPEVQRFGALRDLTLIGLGPDGDGGWAFLDGPFGARS